MVNLPLTKYRSSLQLIGWISTGWLLLALPGCQATRPDIGLAVALQAGLEHAIVFSDQAEAIDVKDDGGQTLSPEQAVRLALLHDPRVQASLARVRVAEADANQARLLPNPIMSIELKAEKGGVNTAFTATVTGDLIAMLEKPGQIAAADNRLRGSAADALTTVLDLINEVQEAYASAVSIDVQIENAERRAQIFRRLRDIAQLRLDAADGTLLDLITLNSQVTQSALDLSDLQLQRTTLRLNLARLIGQPRSPITWQLSAWETPPPGSITPEEAWINAAMLYRPEIQSRAWELKALGDDLNVAAFFPLQGDALGLIAEHDPTWRAGPAVTTPIPIFDFGQAARAKVEAQQVVARHDLNQAQRTVIQEVRVAHATYLQTLESLSVAQNRLLPLLQQQLDLSRLSYQSGNSDLTTLLQAESDLDLTLSRIAELQEKVTVARAKLQRAAGGAGIAQHLESTPATQPSESALPATTNASSNPSTVEVPTSRPATGSVP